MRLTPLTPLYYFFCFAMFLGWASAGICLAADYVISAIMLGAIGASGFFGTQTFINHD